MKSLKDYILEKSNGEVTTISAVGVKNFATIIDRPERIKVVKGKNGKSQVRLCRAAHEKIVKVPLSDGVLMNVGASSGVVIEATSGSTGTIKAAIVNPANKNKLLKVFDAHNKRAIANLGASLSIIGKVPEI